MESNLPADPLTGDPRATRADHTCAGPSPQARREARAGLYVHVPFCATRCTYCDFSSGSLSREAVERYLRGVAVEAGRRSPAAAEIEFTSVFFGGGTPSALSARHFTVVMARLREHFRIHPRAEITLEANPESVRPALLEAWAAGGVNRLSMGAQSFVPEELSLLGRIHPAERPLQAVALARAAGFTRLSLDLMYGYPGHTLERWESSLATALECGIEHLSAYCFIPEGGTSLGDAIADGTLRLPDADLQAECNDALTRRTREAGFAPYETSNFCRPGAEARHNLVYWLRRPYVGLGPSAHGLLHGERYGNHYALARWAAALERGESPESERELETGDSAAEEIVMLGLRLAGGLRSVDYGRGEWRSVSSRFRVAMERAVIAGRLERTATGYRIPARMRFLADDVIAWVAARAARPSVDSARPRTIIEAPCHNLHSSAI